MHPISNEALFTTARPGSNQNVYQQINGQGRCGTHTPLTNTHNRIFQSQKELNNGIV